MDQQSYWLGFSLVSDFGSVRIKQLLNAFGSLEEAWNASPSQLYQSELNSRLVQKLLNARAKLDLDSEMEKVKQAKAQVVTLADTNYPALLREIPDAPAVLYIRGTLIPEDRLALAIVGTRKATKYGRDVAYSLSRHIATHGVTIVSGLAQGIDAAAHEGALAAEGRTIAILGCGIDSIYPREHTALAERIMQQGAIISEFPIGVPPIGKNFPRRNRIISGLSLGILVAEAPESSGALITAETALEQGREVFAIPSNIFNPLGRGTNRLIQDGAKLVMRISDILNELNIVYTHQQTRQETTRISPANQEEAALLQHLGADPIHIDELVRLSNLSTSVVTSTLTILELKGVAEMVGGMQYCRTR